ncbi:MAG TPA: hypothetical protein VGP84_13820 [Gemmatimonadaceae bacterium]|jgi:hypothetical protein|nr:hypothetical protein [Gemmatimonadaceae bacterium]
MKRLNAYILLVCLALATLGTHADAQRRGGGGARGGGGMRGGGGGGMRGGGGGGFRGGGGGMSRGGARTSVTSRPSRPSGGFSRPSAPSGGFSRPSTPTASRPSVGQPATRPSVGQPGAGGGAGGGGNRVANRPAGGVGAGAGGGRTNVGGDRTNIGNGNRGNIGSGDRGNIGNGDRTNISNDRPININDNDIVAGGGHWDGDYGCCYGWGAAAAGFAAGAITAAALGSTVYALPPSCPVAVYGGVTYNHCGGVWYQPQFEGTETTYVVVESPPGAPAQDSSSPPP